MFTVLSPFTSPGMVRVTVVVIMLLEGLLSPVRLASVAVKMYFPRGRPVVFQTKLAIPAPE